MKVKNIDGKVLGGCVDATVRTDGGGVKGLKSPLTTKDNDHAADGITSVCENAIPAIIVGIENVYENNKNGGLVDIVGADVAIPQAVVDMISARFDNTLYWYFIGKRLAFPWPSCRKGKEHLMVSIDIEFEWKLPRCSSCKIFDHVDDDYLKKEKEVILMMNVDEGFVHVKRKEKGENTTQQKANTLPNSKDDVNGACDQPYVSTDVHRDDSSLPNNDNGNPKYFKDDIDLIPLNTKP
ncbi:hypothetical protein Tco_0733522 [Tanacetum coccineum]